MAKLTRKTVQKSVESEETSPSKTPSDDGVEGSLWHNEYSEDAFVSIQRRDDLEQRWVTHGRLAPDDAEPENVAARFGGGQYRVQLKDKNREGKFVQVEQHIFKVPGRYTPPESLPGVQPAITPAKPVAEAPAAAAVPDIMSAGILQLFQASATQQQMMMQMFSSAQQAQATLLQAVLKGDKGLDITALIAAIAPIVKSFVEQPKQERDPLEMLKAVGEIVRANTGKQSDVTDTIAAMRDLMEMKEMLSPGGGESDPLMGSIPKLVEVIAEQHQATKAAGVVPAAPQPKPVAGGKPVGQVPMPLWMRVIRGEGPKLLAAAQAGRDPGLVAEVALEWAPAGIKPAISEFFGREDARQQLMELVPGLQSYGTWVDEFLIEARDLLFGEPPDPAQEELGLTGEEEGGEGVASSEG